MRKLTFLVACSALAIGSAFIAGCSSDPTDLPTGPTETETQLDPKAVFTDLLEAARASAPDTKVGDLVSPLQVVGDGAMALAHANSGDYLDETNFFSTRTGVWFYGFWYTHMVGSDLRTFVFSDRLDEEPTNYFASAVDPDEISATITRVVAALSDSERKILNHAYYDGSGVFYFYYILYLDENNVRREFIMTQMNLM